MKRLPLFVFALILAVTFVFKIPTANAQQAIGPMIFDVRRSLPLDPDEEVTKDFYVNAGPESGLKKGMYVSVVRAVPIHDPIKNMQQATLKIPVGKVKVIEVQRGITVARLDSELTDDDRPTLEFEGIMVGDQLDLGSMTVDAPKKPKPKAKKVAVKVDAPDEGSAEAMAARSAAPAAVASSLSVTPTTASTATSSSGVGTAPVSSAAPTLNSPMLNTSAATPGSGPSAANAKPAAVEMTTAADVKTETPPPRAPTNNSLKPNGSAEEAPKKASEPKSA